jgi:hypothetical protein
MAKIEQPTQNGSDDHSKQEDNSKKDELLYDPNLAPYFRDDIRTFYERYIGLKGAELEEHLYHQVCLATTT